MRAQVKILVDVEETRSSVPRFLSELGVVVEVDRIPVGDYVMPGGSLVERKTVGDLHRSLIDGRLWSQVAALRRAPARAYVMVEGIGLDTGRASGYGIRGTLCQIADNGLLVIRTEGARDSALWLRVLAMRSVQSREGRPTPGRGRRQSVISPAGLLTTVPGVSPACASRLLDRFGSVAAIGAASEADLREVEGIGKARATTLKSLLTSARPGGLSNG